MRADVSVEMFLSLNSIVHLCFLYRKKVSGDYEALNERLQTLPDQLSYDIMVSAIVDLEHSELVLSLIPCTSCLLMH